MDDSIIEDQGFGNTTVQCLSASSPNIILTTTPGFPKISVEQKAFREASIDIFRWVTVSMVKETLQRKSTSTSEYRSKMIVMIVTF